MVSLYKSRLINTEADLGCCSNPRSASDMDENSQSGKVALILAEELQCLTNSLRNAKPALSSKINNAQSATVRATVTDKTIVINTFCMSFRVMFLFFLTRIAHRSLSRTFWEKYLKRAPRNFIFWWKTGNLIR